MKYDGIGIKGPKIDLNGLPGMVQINSFQQNIKQIDIEEPVMKNQYRHISGNHFNMSCGHDKTKEHHNKNPVNAHQKQTSQKIRGLFIFTDSIPVSFVSNPINYGADQFIPPKEIDQVKNSGLSV